MGLKNLFTFVWLLVAAIFSFTDITTDMILAHDYYKKSIFNGTISDLIYPAYYYTNTNDTYEYYNDNPYTTRELCSIVYGGSEDDNEKNELGDSVQAHNSILCEKNPMGSQILINQMKFFQNCLSHNYFTLTGAWIASGGALQLIIYLFL